MPLKWDFFQTDWHLVFISRSEDKQDKGELTGNQQVRQLISQ